MSSDLEQCPRCRASVPASELQSLGGVCLRCLSGMVLDPSRPELSGPPDPLERGLTVGPGHLVGRCELLDLIGQGGMGTVFRARHLELQRDVAVKILHPSLASREEFARRFHLESRALAALDHPNIVRVHDSGTQGDLFYLVMEHVEGGSVRRLLRPGPFPSARVIPLFGMLLEAVAHAHGRGILHRDLKPDNLLLTRDGVLKVGDFGLAKIAGPEASPLGTTETGVAMGTPYYMAPETLEGSKAFDVRSDLYSMGVILHELLTGRAPAGALAAPSKDGAGTDEFDAVVLKALDRTPGRRFQSVSEFAGAFHRATRARGRRRAFLLGAAAAGIFAVVAGWAFSSRSLPAGPPASVVPPPPPIRWTWLRRGPKCDTVGDQLILSTDGIEGGVELAASEPLGDRFTIRFDLNYAIDAGQEPWILVVFKEAKNEIGDSSAVILFPQGDHSSAFALRTAQGAFGLRTRGELPKGRPAPGVWTRIAIRGDGRGKSVSLQVEDGAPSVFPLQETESLKGGWSFFLGGAAREVRLRNVVLEKS